MMTEVLARAAVHDKFRRTVMRPAVPLILAGLLFGLLASVFPSLPAGAAPPSCLVQEGQAIGAVRPGMDLPGMLPLMGSPLGAGAGGEGPEAGPRARVLRPGGGRAYRGRRGKGAGRVRPRRRHAARRLRGTDPFGSALQRY